MKKSFTILLLFLFNCLFAFNQDRYIKTKTPCDNEMLKKIPGRWMPLGKAFRTKISKQQEQEIVSRLDVIQKMAFNVYPEPMAFDGVQGYVINDKDFASQLKLETNAYGTFRSDVNGISMIFYEYFVKFCDYFCGNSNKNEYFKGAGCESGTQLLVSINILDPLFIPLHLNDFDSRVMRIDNRPIKMMCVLMEKWQGYDFYNPEGINNPKMVLFHREGILPYIPVTRKQYLERSIECLKKFFEEIIKGYEKPEGLNLLMDKKERDEQIKKQQKYRDDVIKYYQDELDATTKAGLLDTPAILANGFMNILTDHPIFSKKAVGGQMLVTENPTYIKKDLPKYIPQFIIVNLYDENDGPDPKLNPFRLYDKNFPIEKLQAMIDK